MTQHVHHHEGADPVVHEHEGAAEEHDHGPVEEERTYFGPPTGPIPDPRLIYRELLRAWNRQALSQLTEVGYPADTRGVLLGTILDLLIDPSERLSFDVEYEGRLQRMLGAALLDAQAKLEEAEAKAREEKLLAGVRGNGTPPGQNRQQRRRRR